ncbi:LPS export ABC transporter periplasmic protein LptC [Rhodohalobacter mucosus]|nr:LPS export ABC transporter periplasmic protein LptC [Rhodohalobacter mucosus]
MHSSYRVWAMQATAFLALRKLLPVPVISLLLFGACADLSEYDAQQVRSSLNDSLVFTTESWDVEMMLMQEGRARMRLEGSYAVGYRTRDRKETHIAGPVYVQLFDSLGSVETEAWSNRAVYKERSSEFELFDSVSVRTNTDRQLFSDYLMWSQKTDSISSYRFVTIITPTDSITGRGFYGLTDLSEYTIPEPGGRSRLQ